MAENRFLAKSPQRGLSSSFQPQLQSALMRHAQQRELRPIVVRAAQETLAIELTTHKGEVADRAFDRLFIQSVDGMHQVMRMACMSAGLSPDDPEVRQMCVEATEVVLKDYVQFKQDVLRGIGQQAVALATEDPRPADLNEERKGFWGKVADKFWDS
jgi:hypothetical protein